MNEVKLGQAPKFLLDLGPLLAFFLANWKFGLLTATGVLMAATCVSLLITYYLTKTVSKFTLISACFIGVFGAATLYFQDTWYLKAKVTLIETLFAGFLFAGLYFKKYFIKDMMGHALDMPDDAWRTLTIRWGLFFIAMAILNLVIWKFFSEGAWVSFKAFGLLGCTIVFVIANTPFMAKYMKD
jgi:intracellular septation protein